MKTIIIDDDGEQMSLKEIASAFDLEIINQYKLWEEKLNESFRHCGKDRKGHNDFLENGKQITLIGAVYDYLSYIDMYDMEWIPENRLSDVSIDVFLYKIINCTECKENRFFESIWEYANTNGDDLFEDIKNINPFYDSVKFGGIIFTSFAKNFCNNNI